MKIRLLLETKNVAIFIKICFHLKRGCMKMLKHAETLYADKSCYMAIVFFLPISLFPKKKFRVQFSNIICTKTIPSTPQLFIWKWITSTFSFILLEKNSNVVSPWGPLFQRGPFFRGSVFSQVQDRQVGQIIIMTVSGISNRYTYGIPFSKNWIVSHVRKKELYFKKKAGRHLSAESNMGKRNWRMMKRSHMKTCW